MNRKALYCQPCGRRIKGFKFNLTRGRAVHCICKLRSEFFQIQKGSAMADFFIGCETDTDFSMRDPVIDQAFTHGHDL